MLTAEWNWDDALAYRYEEGREEGEKRKSFSIAQNLVRLGLPIETVITATQLDPEKVKTLYQQ